MRSALFLLALSAPLAALSARADENKDLNLIPETVHAAPAAPEAATRDAREKIFVENAFTVDSLRGNLLVPVPPPLPPNWQERLFVDLRKEWALWRGGSLTYSGRFNLEAADETPFPSHRSIRHDFREGFLSWQATPETFLDLGRVNLKNGVAVGFNPTDFFKARAVVQPLSADPAALREDRLGTFMLRGQRLFERGVLEVAYAPKLYDPSRLYTSATLPSFDPVLDRTNAHDRVLLKASAEIVGRVSPEVLVYHEGNRTSFGANISESIGQSTILYAEWAGGRRQSLIADALRYGVDTGTLPGNAPNVLPLDRRTHFQNDLAIGGSYTTEAKIVFNLEYHFHQAAFSNRDWSNWFAVGRGPQPFPSAAPALWFIRSYALDQQVPISTHAVFLRADWSDAFIPHLELTGFANIDLADGSTFVQGSAAYDLSSRWSFGLLAAANLGGRRSDRGSLPLAASVILKLARYF